MREVTIREGKSFRYVAMVAKYLDDDKQNVTHKIDSNCFKLHRSYSISFNLSNVGEIFWVESEREKKGKRTFLCCAHLLYRAGE